MYEQLDAAEAYFTDVDKLKTLVDENVPLPSDVPESVSSDVIRQLQVQWSESRKHVPTSVLKDDPELARTKLFEGA